jgi:hypothetical protein
LKLPAVARIIAETLSGYIMFGTTRLVCHVVPLEQCHYGLFLPNRRPEEILIEPVLTAAAAGTKSLEKMPAPTQRLVAREKRKNKQLAALGIEYDFPGYSTFLGEDKDTGNRNAETHATIALLRTWSATVHCHSWLVVGASFMKINSTTMALIRHSGYILHFRDLPHLGLRSGGKLQGEFPESICFDDVP